MAKLKAMVIHAHFDDYEFCASGIFELWKRQLGDDFQGRVIICTDGKAGHQFRTRDETGAMRLAEMEASAKIGGFEFKSLRLRDGNIPREACLECTTEFMAALWKEVRDFEPDYLFCPPMITDPYVGIHNDHVKVAEGVRRIAYMINVPHAYTPEYPADETNSPLCKVPVILNCYDSYMKSANDLDVFVDVTEAFDKMVEMSYCHQSQIVEWLPWVASPGILHPPKDLDEWREILRERFYKRDAAFGLDTAKQHEVFTLTAWGTVPNIKDVSRDFPNLTCNEAALAQAIAAWSNEAV